jgi:hypothetical protein
MIVISIQEGNNYCPNIVEGNADTLSTMCQSFLDYPSSLGVDSNRKVASCCNEEFVDADLTVCGNGGILGKLIPCHEKKPIFDWDLDKGINMDIMLLVLDIVLFCAILVVVDTGLTARLRVWMREKAGVSSGGLDELDSDELDDDVIR